jgi:predicted enzyme related to lactoylglutathione lyase
MSGTRSKFVWFDLVTNDVKGATDFYQSVIGWSVRDAGMPDLSYNIISMGSSMVGGLMALPTEEATGTPCWLGYIAVDDVDRAAVQVNHAGGKTVRPPSDIPGVGRFAIVTDPQGASFVLFSSPGMPNPAEVQPGDFGRVGWHELRSTNAQAAFNFYSTEFGWVRSENFDGDGIYRALANGERAGDIVQLPSGHSAPEWLHFFTVESLSTAVELVKEGGGRIAHDSDFMADFGKIARCADPQGAHFGLVELHLT